jgi:hypothetical protein
MTYNMVMYIRTSLKNYLINLVISGLLALFSGFLLYIQLPSEYGKIILVLLFVLLIFLRAFRILEYILTKKSIAPNKIFLFGEIDSGEKAKRDFYWNLAILIIFELIIIFYRYIQ